MAELEQAMTLLSQTLEREELVTDIGREAVGIIMRYARAWRLLLDYGEGNVLVPPVAATGSGRSWHHALEDAFHFFP